MNALFLHAYGIGCSHFKAIEDKSIENKPDWKKALKYIDKAFTFIFLGEMVIKQGAYGFKKYFTDAWCWLDFIIVAVRSQRMCLPAKPTCTIAPLLHDLSACSSFVQSF